MAADFALRQQIFLMAGSDYSIDLDEDEELIIPEELIGKIEVRWVQFGMDRVVHLTALDNIYLDPADMVSSPESRAFDLYRDDLSEFLEYRATLAEGYEG